MCIHEIWKDYRLVKKTEETWQSGCVICVVFDINIIAFWRADHQGLPLDEEGCRGARGDSWGALHMPGCVYMKFERAIAWCRRLKRRDSRDALHVSFSTVIASGDPIIKVYRFVKKDAEALWRQSGCALPTSCSTSFYIFVVHIAHIFQIIAWPEAWLDLNQWYVRDTVRDLNSFFKDYHLVKKGAEALEKTVGCVTLSCYTCFFCLFLISFQHSISSLDQKRDDMTYYFFFWGVTTSKADLSTREIVRQNVKSVMVCETSRSRHVQSFPAAENRSCLAHSSTCCRSFLTSCMMGS